MTTMLPMQPSTESGFPHNYSGEMKKMTFEKPFLFTHTDHQRETFRAGVYDVPVEVANHWYAVAHSDAAVENHPAPGTPAFAEKIRLDAAAATDRRFAQQQADMLKAADVNRKAIEEQVRLEMTDKLRAEIKAQVEAEMAGAKDDAAKDTKKAAK